MSPASIAASAGRRLRSGLRLPRPQRLIPFAFTVLSVASLAVAIVAAATGEYGPDSTVRTGFGIAAAAALVALMLYSARRSLPAVRSLGRTSTYLELHIYGGLLFLVLMLLHTGFGLPNGTLMVLLWGIALWVIGSGLVGLALQRTVPKVLAATSSFEVNLHRIPELVTDLRARAESLSAQAGPAVEAWYARELAPDMAAPRAVLGSLLGRSRSESYRSQEYQILRGTLAPDAATRLDEIFQLHSTKLEMDLHFTLQRVLRLWLYFHLPVSIVLLGLVAFHVLIVLYY